MSKTVFNLRIDRMSELEFKKILNDFTSLGWEFVDNWELSRVHMFAQFVWNDDGKDPIYPPGFEPNTSVPRIETDKFPRPV